MSEQKIYPTLKDLFTDLRIQSQLRQADLVEAGFKQPYISWMESSPREPGIKVVQKLKDFYGVEITWKQNGFTFKKIK